MMNSSKILNNEPNKEAAIEIVEDDENTVCGVKLKKGDSAYVAYCKNELKKYFDEEEWIFNNTNGSITVYNKRFQSEVAKVNEDLAKEMKFQIWMRRPEKEKSAHYIDIAKPNVGIVLTLKMDAVDIVKREDDTISNIVLDAIGCNIDDRARLFPKEWKPILMEKQNSVCGICKQKMLDINDTEIDHIQPYSEGGKTIFENAQLAHRHCNRSKSNK